MLLTCVTRCMMEETEVKDSRNWTKGEMVRREQKEGSLDPNAILVPLFAGPQPPKEVIINPSFCGNWNLTLLQNSSFLLAQPFFSQ